MPGLTKILMIAKDFPQLNFAPDHENFKDNRKMNIIHQASQVFVFEDTNDSEGERNGTLKLIEKFIEHKTPDTATMHAIRKEFLKRVLVGYIKQIPVKKSENDSSYEPDQFEETPFEISTPQQRKEVRERLLNNLD